MGLPGPENTQSADRTITESSLPPSLAGRIPASTVTSSPTLLAKYPFLVRADRSSAFTWNRYGVSSSTARGWSTASRATSARCTVTIVGLVSPEPMTARMWHPAGSAIRLTPHSRPQAVVGLWALWILPS